jgi:hypothetical protein
MSSTRTTERPASSIAAQPDSTGPAHWLAIALVIAGLAEFLTLRVLIQTGPALENGRVAAIILDGLLIAGLTSMSVAVVLAIIFVVVLGCRLINVNSPYGALTGAAAFTLVGMLTVVIAPFGPATSLMLPVMLLSATIVTSLAFSTDMGWRGRVILTLFAFAGLAIAAHYAVLAANGTSLKLLNRLSLLHVGEIFALLAALSLLLMIRRPVAARAIVAGLAATAFLIAWQSAIPWLPSTVAIWNFGVTTFLPGTVYALALGSFVFAIVQIWPVHRMVGIAVVLIALAGLKWDVAYFNLLGICGLLLLQSSLSGKSIARSLALTGQRHELYTSSKIEAATGSPVSS